LGVGGGGGLGLGLGLALGLAVIVAVGAVIGVADPATWVAMVAVDVAPGEEQAASRPVTSMAATPVRRARPIGPLPPPLIEELCGFVRILLSCDTRPLSHNRNGEPSVAPTSSAFLPETRLASRPSYEIVGHAGVAQRRRRSRDCWPRPGDWKAVGRRPYSYQAEAGGPLAIYRGSCRRSLELDFWCDEEVEPDVRGFVADLHEQAINQWARPKRPTDIAQ
jgi:hypothetical protein